MKRVLFVDDERMVLSGLQRMLRRHDKTWETAFANSGNEALAMLAAGGYDVIVTDMRMPGMDGAELLELVRQRYPGIVRIVLSGQCDATASGRAAPVAHQFLAKPCDPAKLQEVIERCCQCESIVSDSGTRGVIAAIGELPALPHTYAALVEALNDPQATLERVGAIIEGDIAVAAKVLQLVNSAFFGLSHEIATVQMAVGYLGFEVLKQLVMAVELFRTFSCDSGLAGFSIEEMQRHSRSVAAIAARLPVAPQNAAATSIAALLHDVGKLILAARLKTTFAEALKTSVAQKRPLYSIEQEMMDTTHAEIGAYLLALWGLPPAVVTAVSRHHRPMNASADDRLDIPLAVRIADLLANEAEGKLEACKISDAFHTELVNWDEMLPQWRKMAELVVQTEGQR